MRRLVQLATWAPIFFAFACGGSSSDPSNFNPNAGSGSSQNTGQNGPTATGGAVANTGTSTGTGTGAAPITENITAVVPVQDTSPGQTCTEHIEIGQTGLDIVIMMDKSVTMTEKTASGNTKWNDVNNAIKQFVKDPRSTGIGVGIGFFAIFLESPCEDGDCISCNPADYGNLKKYGAPIAELGANTQNVVSAIDKVVLEGGNSGGETPTYVALQGAIQAAEANLAQHPDRKTVVILATDGLPNVCNSSMANVLSAAKAGVSKDIKTYVVGILAAPSADTADSRQSGQELPNLNQMAEAGGTGAVFLVDTTGAATNQFVTAMNSIRDANQVGCQFDIPNAPSGKAIQLNQATVTYKSGGGNTQSLGWLATSSACGTAPGFYYDDNKTPQTIRLCKATCDAVSADRGAVIDIALACPEGGTTATGGGGGGNGQGGGGSTTTTGSGDAGIGANAGHGGEPNANSDCRLDGQICTDKSTCCSNTSHSVGTNACVCGAPVN